MGEAKVETILLALPTKRVPQGLITRKGVAHSRRCLGREHWKREGWLWWPRGDCCLLLALGWDVPRVCWTLHSHSQEKGSSHFTSHKQQISNCNNYLENVTHEGSNARRQGTRTRYS